MAIVSKLAHNCPTMLIDLELAPGGLRVSAGSLVGPGLLYPPWDHILGIPKKTC